MYKCARSIEDVFGCKWAATVLCAISKGVNRPGALQRHIEGISSKVLSERLRKLVKYRLAEKIQYPEFPPRTEYRLTRYGANLAEVVKSVKELNKEVFRYPPV